MGRLGWFFWGREASYYLYVSGILCSKGWLAYALQGNNAHLG